MRKYTKEAPEKEPSGSSSQKQKREVSNGFIQSKALSKGYSKAEGWRIPKTFYVLISGGEKREKDYFKMLLSGDKFKRIKLSFEIWLFYGKEENPPTDFPVPTDRLKISQAFKTYLGTKVKGGVNPKKALYDIKSAIGHAKKHYEEDNNGIPKLFSTNMFVLASQLLPLIDEELFYNDKRLTTSDYHPQ